MLKLKLSSNQFDPTRFMNIFNTYNVDHVVVAIVTIYLFLIIFQIIILFKEFHQHNLYIFILIVE